MASSSSRFIPVLRQVGQWVQMNSPPVKACHMIHTHRGHDTTLIVGRHEEIARDSKTEMGLLQQSRQLHRLLYNRLRYTPPLTTSQIPIRRIWNRQDFIDELRYYCKAKKQYDKNKLRLSQHTTERLYSKGKGKKTNDENDLLSCDKNKDCFKKRPKEVQCEKEEKCPHPEKPKCEVREKINRKDCDN